MSGAGGLVRVVDARCCRVVVQGSEGLHGCLAWEGCGPFRLWWGSWADRQWGLLFVDWVEEGCVVRVWLSRLG